MKHKYKDIKGSRREFLFEVPAEEVKKRIDKAFDEIREVVTVPGFRRGKVPREILEKYHGREARDQAARDMVSDSYSRALKESKTIPVGLPQISDIEFTDGKTATYKAIVDIRPKIDFIACEKIKVMRKSSDVKEEEVEKYISMVQESYAQFKDVVDRASRKGDYVICDVSAEADGKPLHEDKKDIWFLMDKNHSLPELVDGLTGARKGDDKEITAVLPDEEDKEKKAPAGAKNDKSGKKAIFKIKVKMIKEKELPEINDEFIKKLGGLETVDKFKEAARNDLKRKKENDSRVDIKNQILERLLKSSQFIPPQGLVEEERESLVQEAKDALLKNKISEDDITKRIKEMEGKFDEEAPKRVKLYFILDEIARNEGISVSDDEINASLELMAKQSNITVAVVKKKYGDANLTGYLRNQIKENKITEFLFSKVNIITATND